MREKAVALFLLALLLFLLPLELLFPRPQGPFGLPPLYLYLFGAWGLVILLAHRFLASLLLNLGLTRGVSLLTRGAAPRERRTGEVEELSALLRRVLGLEAEEAFRKEAQGLSGPEAAARAEALLAGAVGPATARLLLSVTREAPPEALLEAARESREVRAYAKALEEARRELSEAYERLKALDQAKDELLWAVAHEFKTPLTSVRALAEILRAHPDLPEEERRRFTELLSKEALRLSRLVEEVLAYTRLQGGLPLRLEPTDLKALAGEALALAEPLAREKGVRIEAHLEEVHALTDRDRVLQVLLNLLHNALRHARSLVRLELGQRDGEVLFRVQDDGPGVPEALRPRIFEPFQSFAGGTGLGLFLARRLVEALRGRIWLEEGEGARFAFALPLEVNHADPGGGRRGKHPDTPGVSPEEGGA